MTKHKENCSIINGKENVKLGKSFISFKNYSKQLPVPFKIYADFECILCPTSSKKINNENISYTKNIKIIFLVVICIDNKFSKDIDIYRGKDAIYKFIEKILEEYDYCNGVMKRYFNKSLIMTVNDKEIFQLTNSCWICNKLFDAGDEKVRDDCQRTGKFRGAAHFSCNANFVLTKKVPVVFHNLRDYGSHLIIREISNFDVTVNSLVKIIQRVFKIS